MLTPSIPSVPRGTHSSAHKTLKPPIHNPYDKFTQPEFDAWIEDLTDALRGALGRHTEVPRNKVPHAAEFNTPQENEEGEVFEDEFEDENIDHSVAERGTRKLKGKARDPREGSGLGEKNQPIEIESDSELEERASDPRYQWRERQEESDDDDPEDDDLADIGVGLGSNPHEPIELLSDEEEVSGEDEREAVANSDNAFRVNKRGHPKLSTYRREAEAQDGEDENRSDVEPIFDNEPEGFPPAPSPSQPLDLPDPWDGPRTYAEDFYSGGDFPEIDLDPSQYSPSNLTPLREAVVTSISPTNSQQHSYLTTNGYPLNRENECPLPGSSPSGLLNTLDDLIEDEENTGVGDSPGAKLHSRSSVRTRLSPPEPYGNNRWTEDDEDELEEIDKDAVHAPYEGDNTNFGDDTNNGETFRGENTQNETDIEVFDLSSDAPDTSTRRASVDHPEDARNEGPGPISTGDGYPSSLHLGRDEDEEPPQTVFMELEVESTCEEAHDFGAGNDTESIAGGAIGESVIDALEETLAERLPPNPEDFRSSTSHVYGKMFSPLISEVFSVETYQHTSEIISHPPDHGIRTLPFQSGTLTTDYQGDSIQSISFPESQRMSSEDRIKRQLPEVIPMPVLANPDIPDPASQSPPLTTEVSFGLPEMPITPSSSPVMPSTTTPVVIHDLDDATTIQRSSPGSSASSLFTSSSDDASAPENLDQTSPSETIHVEDVDATSELPTSQGDVTIEPRMEEILDPTIGSACPHKLIGGVVMDNVLRIPSSDAPPEASSSALHCDSDDPGNAIPASLVPTLHRTDTTDPILYSDPYPYSLSTPGSDLYLSTQSTIDKVDAGSDQDHEQSTPSTPMKDLDFQEPTVTRANGDLHEDPFLCPSDGAGNSDTSLSVQGGNQNLSAEVESHNLNQAVDTDAAGRFDAEVVSHEDGGEKVEENLSQRLYSAPENEDAVSQIGQDELPAFVSENIKDNSERSSEEQPLEDPFAIDKSVPGEPPTDENLSHQENKQDQVVTEKLSPKRKRRPSLSTSPSKTTFRREPHEISREGKGKGKGKVIDDGDEDYEDSGGDDHSISSSSRSVLKILLPGSRTSSVPSNGSTSDPATPISPSLGKQASSFTQEFPPLFHAHGPARHLPHHRPPLHVQKQPIDQQETTRTRAKDASAEVAPSLQKTPSQRSLPISNSPVTRSHCRFRKISVPLDEGGPRVCFLVPGCSLGNRELMDLQEIEDHGDATVEDSRRMVTDIKSMDFSSYLIGILRQLVGVDLLREQEVYYIPLPGEELSWNSGRKSALTRLSPPDGIESGGGAGSFRTHAGSGTSPHSRSPLSTHTAKASTSKGGSEGNSRSTGSSADAESHDGNSEPRAKRQRKGLRDSSKDLSESVTLASPSEPEVKPAPPSIQRIKTRRSRRLGIDAAEYKPDKEEPLDSTDEDDSTAKKSRRKQHGRGIKRARTKDEEEDQTRKLKTKKRRASSTA